MYRSEGDICTFAVDCCTVSLPYKCTVSLLTLERKFYMMCIQHLNI